MQPQPYPSTSKQRTFIPSQSNAHPVLVIGGGQAGLAAGYRLQERSIRFLIVEAHSRVGESWRRRYASLTLFTPRGFSALPGLPLAGDPEGYASGPEFAHYLENYARRFALPISKGSRVMRLAQREDGSFVTELSTGETLQASYVIIASGGFQIPHVPTIARNISEQVEQYTPESYRDPSHTPPGAVLVVGDGASGRDIAIELGTTHRVLLATGRPRKLLPERFLGRSVWWWLNWSGLMQVSGNSLIGRRMRRMDPFPDRGRSLRRLEQQGVEVMPRVRGADGTTAIFADSRSEEITAVIWAIGYRDDTSWIDIPGIVDAKGFVHSAGASPIPRLFFIGRPWQRNRASALVMGVGEDAALIADAIAKHMRSRPKPTPTPSSRKATADRRAQEASDR